MIDELFGGSLFDDAESLIENSPQTGYSISVVQTSEGTKVKAKVGKNMDAIAIKEQLQRQYPNLKIEIEGGKIQPLIREISTKPLKPEVRKEEEKKGNG